MKLKARPIKVLITIQLILVQWADVVSHIPRHNHEICIQICGKSSIEMLWYADVFE